MKKKKLEEIKVGPFGSMYEAWKDIDDFCKRERKNIEDLEKDVAILKKKSHPPIFSEDDYKDIIKRLKKLEKRRK